MSTQEKVCDNKKQTIQPHSVPLKKVRHIVMVDYRDGFSEEENKANAQKIKVLLEGLKSVILGIIEFNVVVNVLSTSNKDIVFNTLFESVESLAAYQIHPAHVEVSNFVGTVMQNRVCIDYYE